MPRFSHHISRNEEVVRSDCSLWSFEASLAAVRNQPPPVRPGGGVGDGDDCLAAFLFG